MNNHVNIFAIINAFLCKRKSIVFLVEFREWQFCDNLILQYAKDYPEHALLVFFKDEKDKIEKRKLLPPEVFCFSYCKVLFYLAVILGGWVLTTESYVLNIPGQKRLHLFHGQPSKGLSFSVPFIHDVWGVFLYGPFQKDAFYAYVQKNFPEGPWPQLYSIGYPKSDALLNKKYRRSDILQQLGLSLEKKTVLYAPAFNEGASLREFGVDIIKILCQMSECNIIAKLPIDCQCSLDHVDETGGIDNFSVIENECNQYENFRLYKEDDINPVLAAADVLITCMSSVSFEFLVLGKPVVFIDTPRFYSTFLRRRFPLVDLSSWEKSEFVNAGKKYGRVEKNIQHIALTVRQVLTQKIDIEMHAIAMQRRFLYNPGKATMVATLQLHSIVTMAPPQKWTVVIRSLCVCFFRLVRLFFTGKDKC